MSNFSALIATIQANIKTNGNEEITGVILQDVLEAMVQALGNEAINNLETALGNEETERQNADGTLQDNIDAEALRAGTAEAALDGRLDTIEGEIPSAASSSNKLTDKAYVDAADTALANAIGAIEDNIENGYVYAGIATPSGTPVSGKVFYLAVTAGTYTNFGGLVVTQGINILKYNGTAWSQEQLIGIDDEPVERSDKLVRSGGVNKKFRLLFRDSDKDFAIADENGNAVLVVKNGQIKTLKFDSENIVGDYCIVADYAIADKNKNAIVLFEGGHIKMKNFQSDKALYVRRPYSIDDFAFTDENGNAIVVFGKGHIRTKNFNSEILNSLTGKKISILGDSISTYSGYMYSEAAYCAYPSQDVTNVKKTYWMKTINDMDAFLGVNDSWAGTMVSNTQPTDSGAYGPNRCLSSQTRISHLGENGTPDVIIVYGGTNDIGQQVTIGTFNTENPINYTDAQIAALPVATFADAYRAMMIRLQKTYPLSRIVAILPNYVNSSLDHYISDDLDEYIEMERTICDYFGVKYLDCRTCGITLFNRSTYLGDGIHPNSLGMELIASQLEKLLLTL